MQLPVTSDEVTVAPAVEPSEEGPTRATLATCALVGAVAGAVGPFLPGVVGVWAVLALVALVPGSLVLGTLRPLPRPLGLIAVPLIGASLVSLLVSLQLGVGLYVPQVMRWLLVLLGIGGGVWLRRAARPRVWGVQQLPGRPPQKPPVVVEPVRPWREPLTPGAIAALVCAVLGAMCWLVGLPAVHSAQYSTYGLLARVPLLAVAALLCVTGVVIAIRAGAWLWAWVCLVLLILARRGVTLFGVDVPLYQWTYRHLGVMDWFTHSGTLARDVDVYSSWPGALALWAWVTDVSGFSRFDLATAYILVHHLVLLAVVYAFARAARLGRRAALTAVLLVEVTDWVGQDYLAPQSFGFMLGTALITALLTGREPRYRVAAEVVAAVLFAGVCWAHQLTPLWVMAVVGGLLVFRRVRWTVPAVFAAIWMSMLALNIGPLMQHSTGISFDILDNAGGNIKTTVSAGQAMTSRILAVLALTLWGGAGLATLWRLRRRDRSVLVPALIAFSPFILLITGYGGEAVYRVYLYSLPGVALLLAPVLTAALERRVGYALGAAAAILGVALAGVQGSVGGWFTATFTRAEVDAAVKAETAAGTAGVVMIPTIGFPTQVTWHYVPQARAETLAVRAWALQNELVTEKGLDATPVDLLTKQSRHLDAPVYVVIARPMYAYAEQYGSMPRGGLNELASMLESRNWVTVSDSSGVRIFSNQAGLKAWGRTGQVTAVPAG